MKKKLFICLSFFLTWNYCKAQYVFQRNYLDSGYYASTSFDITSDGGFIMVGEMLPFGSAVPDIYMLKTDSSGAVEWLKIYGDTLYDMASSVKQTFDGGYIIGGFSYVSNTYTKIILIKTDSNGDTLWTKKYGGSSADFGADFICQTNDSGYVIAAGEYDGNSTGGLLFKTDGSGNLLWAKGTGKVNSFCPTSDGGFIFLRDYFFIEKADSAGNILWMKRIWDPMNLYYYSGACTISSDGGYVFAGNYNNSQGLNGAYMAKTNSAGDTLWTRCYPISDVTYLASIHQTMDGGYIASGACTGVPSAKAFALKIDSIGNIMWERLYSESIISMLQHPDGGFIMNGSKYNPGAPSKGILIKTDGSGNSWCNDSLVYQLPFVPYAEILNYSITSQAVPLLNYDSHPIVSSATPTDTIICISQVGINEHLLNKAKIYPNPFTSILTIVLGKQNIKQANFSVKNVLGQTVFNEQENNFDNNYTKTIDLSFLSKGIYLLDIFIDGQRTVKKIVKE